jgi:D-sedoheptulose 7-phosphate isomerase
MPAKLTIQGAATQSFARRESAAGMLARDAERIARVGRDMAARFRRGGKLITYGHGAASADASHLAVEFMHPAGTGTPALPAIAMSGDATALHAIGSRAGTAEVFAHQVRHWGDPTDIALGLSPDGDRTDVRHGLKVARELGLLTIALTGGDGGALARGGSIDHVLIAGSTDAVVIREVHVTVYHLLSDLVRLFLEHWPSEDEQRPPRRHWSAEHRRAGDEPYDQEAPDAESGPGERHQEVIA